MAYFVRLALTAINVFVLPLSPLKRAKRSCIRLLIAHRKQITIIDFKIVAG